MQLLNLRGLLLGTLILLLGLCRMLLRELLSLGDLLLSLFKPCIELLDLSRLLLGHHNLLLCGSQLTGQVFGLCTECVALMLHGGQLFARSAWPAASAACAVSWSTCADRRST